VIQDEEERRYSKRAGVFLVSSEASLPPVYCVLCGVELWEDEQPPYCEVCRGESVRYCAKCGELEENCTCDYDDEEF